MKLMNRIVVIAPHPDDEVIGMGGTIKKLTSTGKEVFVCIVTRGTEDLFDKESIKQDEEHAIEVKDFLKVKDIQFLNFPAVKLDTIPQHILNNKLQAYLDDIKPDTVFVSHYGDVNMDHRAVYESVLVATRPKPNMYVKKVLAYETVSSTEWRQTGALDIFVPNFYVSIDEYIEDKCKSLEMYIGQILKYPHPRSSESLRVLAKHRGTNVGVNYAEAFQIIRWIY